LEVRSYHQYCGLARALDVVGDRWALLVVRELLEGPRRYNELLEGLPGIATNLLAERLRSLETAGVVERREGNRYALTPWGEGLHDVVYAFGRWAGPLMLERGDDAFRPQWLRHMVIARFHGVDHRRRDMVVELRLEDGEPMTLLSAAGRVHLVRGPARSPDVVLAGPPDGVAGLVGGRLSRAEAEARGVTVRGDARKLAGLRPRTGLPVQPGEDQPAPRAASFPESSESDGSRR
jgi:DNA-binding HxlR family transcriptional regulator